MLGVHFPFAHEDAGEDLFVEVVIRRLPVTDEPSRDHARLRRAKSALAFFRKGGCGAHVEHESCDALFAELGSEFDGEEDIGRLRLRAAPGMSVSVCSALIGC